MGDGRGELLSLPGARFHLTFFRSLYPVLSDSVVFQRINTPHYTLSPYSALRSSDFQKVVQFGATFSPGTHLRSSSRIRNEVHYYIFFPGLGADPHTYDAPFRVDHVPRSRSGPAPRIFYPLRVYKVLCGGIWTVRDDEAKAVGDDRS